MKLTVKEVREACKGERQNRKVKTWQMKFKPHAAKLVVSFAVDSRLIDVLIDKQTAVTKYVRHKLCFSAFSVSQ